MESWNLPPTLSLLFLLHNVFNQYSSQWKTAKYFLSLLEPHFIATRWSGGIPQRCFTGGTLWMDGDRRQQLWLGVGPVDHVSPYDNGWVFLNGKMESMPRKG